MGDVPQWHSVFSIAEFREHMAAQVAEELKHGHIRYPSSYGGAKKKNLQHYFSCNA